MSDEEPQILQKILQSQIRMEETLRHVALTVQVHHRSLYGDDGSMGVIGRQRRVEATIKTLAWVLGLAAPLATAIVVIAIQSVA